jgi:uncharacterized protein (TIGR00725 family)
VARSKVITVFGTGLRRRSNSDYARARSLGRELASRGFTVCTGGYGGVMEAVSRGAKEARGHTIGITAGGFATHANRWIDEEVRARSWRHRLFELIERADAYVVCRGGTGTLVELAVVWEMINKGVMKPRPIIALGSFWKPIVQRMRASETGGHSETRGHRISLIHFARSPQAAADYLARNFR